MDNRVLLANALRHRNAGDWPAALSLYAQAREQTSNDPLVEHNMALCCHALGLHQRALSHVAAAIAQAPSLWQSHALAARVHRCNGEAVDAGNCYEAVLAIEPENGSARLGLADLALNEFGDAAAAAALVATLAGSAAHARDAELTTLMAQVYDRGEGESADLNSRLKAFSGRALRLTPMARRPASGRLRKRVGILSPLLAATPVYFLGFSTFAALSKSSELIFFDRGTRADWATAALQSLAAGWQNVASLDAAALAARLAEADLDVLIDCGGWSDPVGLWALSARPARVQWTWIGGQSATTGLNTIDAWLGDTWQNPPELDHCYTEPVMRLKGGYVDYTPPSYLASIADGTPSRRGVVLAGNPVKIGEAMLQHWPADSRRVSLLDRRYAHQRTRDRVVELLARGGITVEAVIVPHGHADYLRRLSRFAAAIDTRPYSTGLTAVEAAALGVAVISHGPSGTLFSERHQLSHARTGGRNPALAGQIAAMIARA